MDQSAVTGWPSSRSPYYNPISKIRTLIQSLDVELMQLCNQCVFTKNKPSSSSLKARRRRYRTNPTTQSPENETAGGVHTRTLSSIYRSKVIDAYRNRRIFTVHGNYHTVRQQLLRRGWIEKLPGNRFVKLQQLTEDVLLQHARRGNEYETVVISKIISHFPAFFIWQPKAQRDIPTDVSPYRNRVRRGRVLDFSTKIGLIGCAEQEKWYQEEGVCAMSYPRFYRLATQEDRQAFIDDYRLTQCRNLLRYINDNIIDPDVLDAPDGTVRNTILTFAVKHVQKHLADLENATLDKQTFSVESDPMEWHNFITESNKVLQQNQKFKSSVWELMQASKASKELLDRLQKKRPDFNWDGYRNLWILKPGFQCRGIGIIIRRSLEEILQWAVNNPSRKYIAQKYVERPLLIYKTKFDIRQYMLLTIGTHTISIWLYRDCYLRFSSQEFTFDDLRESIHLTNNSVQKKYKNKQNRDPRLPRHNMWSLDQFKSFLKSSHGTSDMWNGKVYPGFKENMIAVVMASMEDTEFTPNAFELYGCDFMLDEEFNPILIEINSTPDLTPSTEVTARICPNALKDVIKVIVDLPRNAHASTGQFDLVYELNYRYQKSADANEALKVSGTTMTLFRPKPQSTLKQRLLRKPTKLTTKKPDAVTRGPTGSRKSKNESETDESVDQDKLSADALKKGSSLKKESMAIRYTLPK